MTNYWEKKTVNERQSFRWFWVSFLQISGFSIRRWRSYALMLKRFSIPAWSQASLLCPLRVLPESCRTPASAQSKRNFFFDICYLQSSLLWSLATLLLLLWLELAILIYLRSFGDFVVVRIPFAEKFNMRRDLGIYSILYPSTGAVQVRLDCISSWSLLTRAC